MTLDARQATLDMRPSTCDPRPATLDLRPSTSDPRQLPKLTFSHLEAAITQQKLA